MTILGDLSWGKWLYLGMITTMDSPPTFLYDNRNRHVLVALYNVVVDLYVAKEVLHIALEDGLCHSQGYVRAHVEEGVAELLHNH